MKKTVVFLVVVMAITASLSAQNSDTLQVRPVIVADSSNLSTALAGKVTGVISYQNEDSVKSLQEFVVGGPNDPVCNGTLPPPLILIDGLEVSSNVLEQLKPDDIQSFSVLKDAKALEMYGTRGTNGVVIKIKIVNHDKRKNKKSF